MAGPQDRDREPLGIAGEEGFLGGALAGAVGGGGVAGVGFIDAPGAVDAREDAVGGDENEPPRSPCEGGDVLLRVLLFEADAVDDEIPLVSFDRFGKSRVIVPIRDQWMRALGD